MNTNLDAKQAGRWKRVLVSATLSLGLLVSACQAAVTTLPVGPEVPVAPVVERGDVQAIPEVTIKTKEFAFEAPQQIAAGWVTIVLQNEGEQAHHVQFLRLKDGVTMEEFGAAMQKGPEALALVSLAGGPGPVNPGSEQRVTVELSAGLHILADLLPGADGVPNMAKGMVMPVEVVENEAAAAILPPQADHEVELLDFAFALPPTIEAGEQVWKITAKGQQPHEMTLLKLAEGKSAMDVQHWMHAPEGAPPFEFAGGLQAVDPGDAGYLHLNLTPGTYLAVCHVPDPQSGQEHLALGMMLPFVVN